MAETHKIVIIGASFAGIPVAHGLLKSVIPALANDKKYQIILVNPTEKFLWKIGMPRVVVKPNDMPLEKVMLDFLPAFSQYSRDQFTFVKGLVTQISPEHKRLSLFNQPPLDYDMLVIASGSSFRSDVWSTSAGHDRLLSSLKDLQQSIPKAMSIIVAGGGPVGVEVSGELGELYGRTKAIHLYSGGSSLLPNLQRKDIGPKAQKMLENQGVTVIHGVKMTKVEKQDDKHFIMLSNGKVVDADVVIDATGDTPNSSFVPDAWLDARRRIKTNQQTLRLDVANTNNIYAIGTVASYSKGTVFDAKDAVAALLESIRLDILGSERVSRRTLVYKQMQTDMSMVPVGSRQGVGTAIGYSLPSFMVRMFKSKDFMVASADKVISGSSW